MKKFNVHWLIFLLAIVACPAHELAGVGDSSRVKSKSRGFDSTRVVLQKEIEVTAPRWYSAASDQSFRANDLKLLPRSSAQDLLRIVPGLVVAQHAGGGKAEQIFLRGFDCDHGTDINISVDNAPVNMVSHGHGQGYADLHFVIPELIEKIDVVKGPYFARFGDLTTAGAVTMKTVDSLKDNFVRLENGSFDSWRGLAMATTKISGTNIYGGGEYNRSRLYFDSPADFRRLNLFAKSHSLVGETGTLVASLNAFSSTWSASGQIPERAVKSGMISSFGSIDNAEGGETNRTTAQVAFTSNSSNPLVASVSFTKYDFQLFSNFTFFSNDSVLGDMIEQTDNRSVFTATFQKSFTSSVVDLSMRSTLGINSRFDDITAGLFHDVKRARVSTTSLSDIKQKNLGIFGEQEFFLSRLTVIAGLRADYFHFDVADKTNLASFRRASRETFLLSPKLNFNFDVSDELKLYVNSGFGFHSNDSRVAVTETGRNIAPRAFGTELGLRWSSPSVVLSVAPWMLDLESEFVWVGDEGTTEQSGRTRRLGIDVEARVVLLDFLTLGTEATISNGRYRDAPIGSNLIALAPTTTATAFASIDLPSFKSALRLRHISDRPANSENTLTATGYDLFDLSAEYVLSPSVTVSFQCENLVNSPWREAQFETTSRLQGETTSVREIHFTSGTPRSIKVGIQLTY